VSTSEFDPKITTEPLLQAVLADVGAIHGATESFRADRVLNKENLFPLLEDEATPPRRLICYLSTGGSIDHSDAAPIGSMLDAMGPCKNLDLMLHSPGGVGEAAEKLIDMCRVKCTGEFRVVVPNYAKSAATMVALGGDVIVMGDRSELGPIDPQYQISVADTIQQVSGQSFIHAYEDLQEEVQKAMAAGESPVGYLQSLSTSTMEPAFIDHCRRGVEFSRDMAKKYLPHQLRAKARSEGKKPGSLTTLKGRAAKIADDLLSEHTRFSHGRLIGATEARDEVGLNVLLLDTEDVAWKAYWELYVRAEVYMQVLPARPSKLFFDRASTLPAF
jgi:hypothetical protein